MAAPSAAPPHVHVPGLPELDDPMAYELDDDEYEDEDEDEEAAADDEDDKKLYGMYQALPVGGEPDWSEAEPSTAEEYLRRVAWERARCADIVRVDVDPNAWPAAPRQTQQQRERQQQEQQPQQRQQEQQGQQDGARECSSDAGAQPSPSPSQPQQQQPQRHARGTLLPPAARQEATPAWAQPSTAWLQGFVREFEALRLRLQDDEGADDEHDVPLLDEDEGQQAPSEDDDAELAASGGGGAGEPCAVAGPSVAGISSAVYDRIRLLDTAGVSELFERHVHTLVVQGADAVPPARAQWLFALAARLEKPLLPDTLASLHALMQHCARARARLPHGAAGAQLPALNVLIAVAGAYFGQDETLCKLAAPDFQALA